MNTLTTLVERESFAVPDFALDDFQDQVREHLFLEFFLARGRLILTPHLTHLTTHEATPAEQQQVRRIIDEDQELLEQLKLFLLHDLALYSALLESNSATVAASEHRLICRFLPYEARTCEVKLYTLPPGDPLEKYGDRIYIGRDCLPLDSPVRPHLGLGYLRRSLPEQLDKLRLRLDRHVTTPARVELEREYVKELSELIEEFSQKADALLGSCTPEISLAALGREELLRVNHEFRELRHILADGEVLVREMEEQMLRAESHAARYVTKLRKDLVNDINYVMLKVNGRINDAVNGIHL